jgi:hypothetical protein
MYVDKPMTGHGLMPYMIPVAVARHPGQAIPLEGSWFGDAKDYLGMSVNVAIHNLWNRRRRLLERHGSSAKPDRHVLNRGMR